MDVRVLTPGTEPVKSMIALNPRLPPKRRLPMGLAAQLKKNNLKSLRRVGINEIEPRARQDSRIVGHNQVAPPPIAKRTIPPNVPLKMQAPPKVPPPQKSSNLPPKAPPPPGARMK